MCKLVRLSENNDLLVADLKKDMILNIIDNAHLCDEIKQIILFGSALEERCTTTSDIDIAIVGEIAGSKFNKDKGYLNFRKKVFEYDWNQDYDMLYFKDTEGDIAVGGSVIYTREG